MGDAAALGETEESYVSYAVCAGVLMLVARDTESVDLVFEGEAERNCSAESEEGVKRLGTFGCEAGY